MEELTYFFSYARRDGDFVLKLAKELRAVGANLWLDQLDILGGQRWDKAVEEALRRCQGMIIVLSPESLASDHVMDEVSFALEKGRLVVPVLLRASEIPFRLRRVQHIDFTGEFERGFQQLLRALRIEPATQPVTQPAAQPAAAALPAEPRASDRAEPAPLRQAPAAVPMPAAVGVDTGPRAASISAWAPPPTGAAEGVRGSPTSQRRPILLWAATAMLAGFSAFLLSSNSSGDATAGFWFASNVLLLTIGSLLCVTGAARPSRVGGLGAAGQIVVLVAMLLQSIGDAGVTVPMNLGIAGILAGLAVYYAKKERR